MVICKECQTENIEGARRCQNRDGSAIAVRNVPNRYLKS